jgi:hypothetical protein
MPDEKKSPLTSDEQDYPQPERMTTPEEEAGMDLEELEDPPQAEGSRRTVEEDLEERERRGGK